MAEERVKRKLSAILSADVKEYSRLMSQDERSTIRTLTTYKEAMSMLAWKGFVLMEQGSLAEASVWFDRLLELSRRIGDARTLVLGGYFSVHLALHRGEAGPSFESSPASSVKPPRITEPPNCETSRGKRLDTLTWPARNGTRLFERSRVSSHCRARARPVWRCTLVRLRSSHRLIYRSAGSNAHERTPSGRLHSLASAGCVLESWMPGWCWPA